MTESLSRIISAAEELWPENLAEQWDYPGLAVGDLKNPIDRVLLSVDVTSSVLEEAIETNCQLVIAHHPFLLRGVKSIATDHPKGRVLVRAVQAEIAIFAAHTNADVVASGVSDTLATSLGLTEIRPLVPNDSPKIGHGRIGLLPRHISLGELALALGRLLPPTASGIRVSGDYDQQVHTVALCGGAGDAFIDSAAQSGADVFITSDLRHHPVQESREQNLAMSLIDVSHWASESLWLNVAKSQLKNLVPGVEFIVSDVRSDPWDFTITQ